MTKKSKAARDSRKRSTRAALSGATRSKKSVMDRVKAMRAAPATWDTEEGIQALLNVLRNRDEPLEVRLAALQSLGAAAFSSAAFESCRGDYIATLRAVAEDPEPALRRRALGVLARDKDGFAQKRLIEGLKNPEKAMVPPEKALQLLSYDIHADAYAVARDIVRDPPNVLARREALRLLAADATSAPMFEKLLRDKGELREIRQIAASALQTLQPDKLQKHAREMLLDKSEYDDIKATSLSALTNFGDDVAIAGDKALLKSVDRLSGGKASTKYKQHARRFLGKYGR